MSDTLRTDAEACWAWVKISDRLPKEGDVIACCAEHRAGGPMFWAGHIVEVKRGFAVMETRGVPPQRFILTYDTLWVSLPPIPATINATIGRPS